jgi:hypothetical protein
VKDIGFLYAFYWAANTLTSTGYVHHILASGWASKCQPGATFRHSGAFWTGVRYGDILPLNLFEVVFIMCVMVTNLYVYSYIVGTVSLTVEKGVCGMSFEHIVSPLQCARCNR